MGDPVELRANGVVELRHAMAVDVAPERRDAVDVGVAVEVEEEAPLGTVDDQRAFLRVGLHRRERMPDVIAVPAFQLFARRVHAGIVPAWGQAAVCSGWL